ncbi:hypothetical protein BGW42_002876 [Actinomortierella wolfii]|nr:hypothetical protein BGW42_002876 [Actinomortierella wolfii]
MDVDVVPESPQFQPLEKEPPDISVAVCDQMDTFNSAGQDALIRELNQSEAKQANEGEQPLSLESVTNDAMANVKPSSRLFCPDDSISGLHTDLERLAFLVSSQGSEMGTQPLTQRRILEELDHFKPSMLASQMPSGSSIATFQTADENKGMVMPSSQGSDDGLNDVDQDLHDTHHHQHQDYLHDNTTRSARASPELISDPIDPIDPAQVKGDNDAPSISSAELSKAASVTVDGPIAANQQSVEVIELADDSVHTDSSEKVAENDVLPKQSMIDALSSVASNTSPLPDPALSTKESDPHEEAGHDFDRSSYIYVLFSNAFHWSVLSVMDRVEIHAPFRKIQLMGASQPFQ